MHRKVGGRGSSRIGLPRDGQPSVPRLVAVGPSRAIAQERLGTCLWHPELGGGDPPEPTGPPPRGAKDTVKTLPVLSERANLATLGGDFS